VDALEAAVAVLARIGEPDTDPEARRVSVPVAGGSTTLPAVVRELDRAGVGVEDVALRRPTLDEVFLRLTGRTDEKVSA
jgi:ABC-2 type transport system ATP-binding protein